MHYLHISEPTLVDLVWSDLASTGKEDYRQTLDKGIQSNAHCLGLDTPVILYGVVKILK